MSEVTNGRSEMMSSLKHVWKLLRCPICMEILTNPVTLRCGSTFCMTCVPSIADCHSFNECPIYGCEHGICFEKLKIDITVSSIINEFHSILRGSVPPFLHGQVNLMLGEYCSIEKIREIIACRICYEILCDPVTTHCGHTFCKECLIQMGFYSKACPICRSQLPTNLFIKNVPTNNTILNFIQTSFPKCLEQQRRTLETEKLVYMDKVPLLISSLVFPQMPCFLTITSPSERIMVTRCIESGKNQFGVVLPGANGAPMNQYGTMLEVKSVRTTDHGILHIDAIGLFRFKVQKYLIYSGYFIAEIIEVRDAHEIELPHVTPTVEDLISTILAFIDFLRKDTTRWLSRVNESTYRRMPSDPFQFSFWAACAIPMNEYRKAKLLEITSTRSRLTLLATWVTELEEKWWPGPANCSIL